MYFREERHKIRSASNCVLSNFPEDLTGELRRRGKEVGKAIYVRELREMDIDSLW